LVLNPDKSLTDAISYIDSIDMLLIMSVNPGFPGQTFMPEVLSKVEEARELIGQAGREIHLAIDGGIQVDNIQQAGKAGADFIVTGSAIFGTEDYQATISSMRNELAKAK